VKVFHKIF